MRGGASEAAAPAPYADTRPRRASSSRSVALDVLRGGAVVLMLLDHVLLVTDSGDLVRSTLTRVCMPVFFLLAGHLAGRPSWRWAWAGLLGLALPVVVPWIDAPNVLLIWAGGCVVLFAWRRAGLPMWLPVVVALTVSANGWVLQGSGYDALALFALMALGATWPRGRFEAGAARLPAWPVLAAVGRRPLTWYVGHLLVLQGLLMVSGAL